MSNLLTTTRYILLTALRDRLFLALPMGLILIVVSAIFLAGTALIEQQEMGIVYSAGLGRLYVMIGLILFVCFHVRRSFENREIELFISRPISRAGFVFSYWLGFSTIALSFAAFLSLILALFFPFNVTGLLVFLLSIALEGLIISAFALAAALIMNSAVSAVLASFGFYVVGRMMGFMLAFLDKPGAFEVTATKWANFGLAGTGMLMPRLDLFGQTEWLLYGVEWSAMGVFMLQAVIYVPLLLMMGMYDFSRRQF